jgi:hypothetical protein
MNPEKPRAKTDDELFKEARECHHPEVSDEALWSAIRLLRETQDAIEFIKKHEKDGTEL